MKTTPLRPEDLRGVFAVPPLARRADKRRAIDLEQNGKVLRHMAAGGLRRFLYGGNAFLYHVTLAEYDEMLGWMAGFPDDHWAIPSVGPSFGRALDQAPLLRRHRFPVAMALPCSDPRDAAGLEAGMREVAEAAGIGLILYLKEEGSFGSDKHGRPRCRGAPRRLRRVRRASNTRWCAPTLSTIRISKALLERVDRRFVISGMGERPAVAHLKGFDLPGFTTGSGCLAPALSQGLYEACVAKDWTTAEELAAAVPSPRGPA